MAKKSYRNDPGGVDRFFSDTPQDSSVADNTQQTQSTPIAQETQNAQQMYYRINLRLRPEYRQYLDDESWKARMSITEYLNELIAADMAAKRKERESENARI